MATFNVGGATFQSGINVPGFGKASGSSGLKIPKVGSVSSNIGIDLSKGVNGLTGDIKLTKDKGNVFRSGATDAETVNDISHQAVCSYFIGPQAENMKFFRKNMDEILNQLEQSRVNYFPEDGAFITEQIQNSAEFQDRTTAVANAVRKTGELLGKHSIPFWSPRYQAHMCMDMSMPALLGYFTTMLYNPNNVAFEASPLSTLAEIKVGEQLCEMFGYNVSVEAKGNRPNDSRPSPWGHVTCDGLVSITFMAQFGASWLNSGPYNLGNAARNLKFYPLSLRMALDGPLKNVGETFTVVNAQNKEDLLVNMPTWDLLNLKVETILDLPDRLNRDYGISSKYLEKVMDDYGIQSLGKDEIEKQFGIEKPAQYMLSSTRHYSWPKAAAIAGIGSQNVVSIAVDHGARLDLSKLEEQLELSLKEKQPVYAVVAIMGTTEEGAVDPLGEVLNMRRRFQARGLSFVVHADAAWGGYFASMLPKDYLPGSKFSGPLPIGLGPATGFVPDSGLRPDTQDDLCKPGASAVSTYLANSCIGLNPDGYGALLGEVTFTCSRLSAQWAAMTDDSMPFTVIPFNMLPSELADDATEESIEAERQWIRDNILSASNLEIVTNTSTSPGGDDALTLLRKLGSDLNINAFACNFKYSNGDLNTDVLEANYFMQRIVESLSVDSPGDDPTKIPLYLTSTEFSTDLYGECAAKFKERLGLKDDKQDLFVLRNVVMSPFPTEKDFIAELAGIFKKVALEAVDVSRGRNEETKGIHSFLMQGENPVCLLHNPSFHVANHRRQTVLEVELPQAAQEWYSTLRSQYPGEIFTFKTVKDVDLTEAIKSGGALTGFITSGASYGAPMLPNFTLNITQPTVDRHLNGLYLASSYPTGRMPFYLYGSDTEHHIDHALLTSPNIQLSAADVKLDLSRSSPPPSDAKRPLVLMLDNVREEQMQPFPSENSVLASLPDFFFRPGKEFEVSVWEDPTPGGNDAEHTLSAWGALGRDGSEDGLVGRGTMVLGESVFVDAEHLNFDPYKRVDDVGAWTEEFEKIGKELHK
ncbi:hypothetical protein INS49_012080 [Diaporthe citri]|uniref:uncharacterized protein n=1 Tax=Diaporthe citri TaxID=83186 RepID=UPI001C7F144C|nr:uncharacterized protein INS49_012080 [Diaporthe citri]KAG6358563.1 hypothetical protein INS49_012080 [Diaporthe citri]